MTVMGTIRDGADLRLLQPNTAQDEGISANSRTQHCTEGPPIWQFLTGSDVIAGSFSSSDRESSQPSIIL